MKLADFNYIEHVTQMQGEDTDETNLLEKLLADARKFLHAKTWCSEILDTYFGYGVGGILGVFLFKILPASNADSFVWVIVGDLPPAYISAYDHKTPKDALSGYLHEMALWVNAAKLGLPVDNLIPVNVPPTKEWASLLSKRLKFIEERILPEVDP